MQINKKDIPSQIEYDLLHANAIQSWIAGNYANGTATADGKPFNLFGSSFQVRGQGGTSTDDTCMPAHYCDQVWGDEFCLRQLLAAAHSCSSTFLAPAWKDVCAVP